MKQIALKTSLPEDIVEQVERKLKLRGVKKSDWVKELILSDLGYRQPKPEQDSFFTLIYSPTDPFRVKGK